MNPLSSGWSGKCDPCRIRVRPASRCGRARSISAPSTTRLSHPSIFDSSSRTHHLPLKLFGREEHLRHLLKHIFHDMSPELDAARNELRHKALLPLVSRVCGGNATIYRYNASVPLRKLRTRLRVPASHQVHLLRWILDRGASAGMGFPSSTQPHSLRSR